ncbi:ribonuclease P protein component [Xanthobacter dioxanivorans]|uniref:Ribonuclease P protein component n=1 Tax=Xanthobacter dioxanivorans TaxID=2528964 RepID=A0A974SK26_9HYPH|nr:ribonuclease P protein component [Xanthobacter dioxanivorans]QRG07824.1 ribonuclease P protein component [Xanthobacter dioxanivorans]
MDRLRKRRDFLAAAKAGRAGGALFLMQGRDRGDGANVRVGFTVTKKIGNAVVRNRIRRRLREAVRHVLPEAGRPGFDYVLVAREGALRAPFDGLVQDIARAVRKLNAPERPRGAGGSRSRKSAGERQAGAPDPDVSDHQPTPADGGLPA